MASVTGGVSSGPNAATLPRPHLSIPRLMPTPLIPFSIRSTGGKLQICNRKIITAKNEWAGHVFSSFRLNLPKITSLKDLSVVLNFKSVKSIELYQANFIQYWPLSVNIDNILVAFDYRLFLSISPITFCATFSQQQLLVLLLLPLTATAIINLSIQLSHSDQYSK